MLCFLLFFIFNVGFFSLNGSTDSPAALTINGFLVKKDKWYSNTLNFVPAGFQFDNAGGHVYFVDTEKRQHTIGFCIGYGLAEKVTIENLKNAVFYFFKNYFINHNPNAYYMKAIVPSNVEKDKITEGVFMENLLVSKIFNDYPEGTTLFITPTNNQNNNNNQQ